MDWDEARDLGTVASASKESVGLQKELLRAFNAQIKAIERQNELQEKANTLHEKTLVALEAITNNTAPKVKHVKPSNKATQL